ncbi:hypothetical protein PybrP1_003892, partial [[Pythium] brassicae (nom. inval.)]
HVGSGSSRLLLSSLVSVIQSSPQVLRKRRRRYVRRMHSATQAVGIGLARAAHRGSKGVHRDVEDCDHSVLGHTHGEKHDYASFKTHFVENGAGGGIQTESPSGIPFLAEHYVQMVSAAGGYTAVRSLRAERAAQLAAAALPDVRRCVGHADGAERLSCGWVGEGSPRSTARSF